MTLYLTSWQLGAPSPAWHKAQAQSDTKLLVLLPYTQELLLK